MPYYAQIDAFRRCFSVSQTAGLVDAEDMIEISGYDTALLGSEYDKTTGQWIAPALTAANRHITTLAFRNRFTRAEKVTLEMAALDNPAAAMAQRQQAAALRADLKDQESATFIDLDRPDTRAGVQALEAAGLIAEGRALQILDAPVQDLERSRGG